MQRWLLRSAVMTSGLLLLAGSAHATTITFDDTLPGNTVAVKFVPHPDVSNFAVSANCSSSGVNQWTCPEASGPVVLTFNLQIPVGEDTGADDYVNVWDDAAMTTISDTLLLAGSLVTPTLASLQFTFQSGPGVTAFLPAPGRSLANFIEGPNSNVVDFDLGDGATLSVLTSPAPVPEPASLLLLGTGLVGAGLRRYRRPS